MNNKILHLPINPIQKHLLCYFTEVCILKSDIALITSLKEVKKIINHYIIYNALLVFNIIRDRHWYNRVSRFTRNNKCLSRRDRLYFNIYKRIRL